MVIKNAIIHRLDNKRKDEPELSDLPLLLTEDLQTVITTHTSKGMQDARIRFAVFKDLELNNVYLNSKQIFDNNDPLSEEKFVECSRNIAKELFKSMKSKTISAADLLVTYFEHENKNYLGILKLDFKDQYISEINETENGKRITISKKENGWPELGSRLQKAAFINDLSGKDNNEEATTAPDPNLIVLDRQTSINDDETDEDVSQFFKDYFLNIKLLDDEKTNTKAFLAGANRYIKIATAVDQEKRQSIYDSALDLLINSENIDLDSFVNSHFDIESKDSTEVKNHLEMKKVFKDSGVVRGQFKKHAEYTERLRKKRKLKLDGINLEIDSQIWSDIDKFQIKYEPGNNDTTFVNITIKNVRLIRRD
ncbi:hypothetical protein EIJ82_00280 [Alkalihalobacillus clausii]|nr:hypothetical protein [Shouchella clausii]